MEVYFWQIIDIKKYRILIDMNFYILKKKVYDIRFFIILITTQFFIFFCLTTKKISRFRDFYKNKMLF